MLQDGIDAGWTYALFKFFLFENLTLGGTRGGGPGGGILPGFTHYPNHLILNSVIDPKG
jgi:hypothetical protein